MTNNASTPQYLDNDRVAWVRKCLTTLREFQVDDDGGDAGVIRRAAYDAAERQAMIQICLIFGYAVTCP